jgi:hypothetical protein
LEKVRLFKSLNVLKLISFSPLFLEGIIEDSEDEDDNN